MGNLLRVCVCAMNTISRLIRESDEWSCITKLLELILAICRSFSLPSFLTPFFLVTVKVKSVFPSFCCGCNCCCCWDWVVSCDFFLGGNSLPEHSRAIRLQLEAAKGRKDDKEWNKCEPSEKKEGRTSSSSPSSFERRWWGERKNKVRSKKRREEEILLRYIFFLNKVITFTFLHSSSLTTLITLSPSLSPSLSMFNALFNAWEERETSASFKSDGIDFFLLLLFLLPFVSHARRLKRWKMVS